MVFMMILKVTPVRNVIISKHCFKSDKPDMFFCKVVGEDSKVEIYDVAERKQKALTATDLVKRNHRVIINNKMYFICSIIEG